MPTNGWRIDAPLAPDAIAKQFRKAETISLLDVLFRDSRPTRLHF
jgi:hypothetical protein